MMATKAMETMAHDGTAGTNSRSELGEGGQGRVGAGWCVIDHKLEGRKQLLVGASQSIFPSGVGKSDYTT